MLLDVIRVQVCPQFVLLLEFENGGLPSVNPPCRLIFKKEKP